jgi:hypothetical protein
MALALIEELWKRDQEVLVRCFNLEPSVEREW